MLTLPIEILLQFSRFAKEISTWTMAGEERWCCKEIEVDEYRTGKVSRD